MLPNSTLDQRIATGFLRCGVSTNEAGIIEDEYAEIYAKDPALPPAEYAAMTIPANQMLNLDEALNK